MVCWLFVGIFIAQADHAVNINTATLEELDTLPGVGPTIAQRIVDGRPYTTPEEISKVEGIGEPGSKTYDDIIPHITVSGDSSGETNADSSQDGDASDSLGDSSSSNSSSSSSESTTSGTLRIIADTAAIAGAETDFEAQFSKAGDDASYVNYDWNFGDGTTGKGIRIQHAYLHPGKYVVTLFADTSTKESEARMTIEVFAPQLHLFIEPGGVLGVNNTLSRETEIGGFRIVQGEQLFYIPQGTVVLAKETLRFSPVVLGFAGDHTAKLLFQSGAVAATASYGVPESEEPPPAASRPSPVAKAPAVAEVPISSVAPTSTVAIAAASYAPSGDSLAAAAAAPQEKLPLWSYLLGLTALTVFGAASALFVQRARPQRETKVRVGEFEILDAKE